jgi:hypothetical protein
MSLHYYLRVGGISIMAFFASAAAPASDHDPQPNNAVVLAATLAKLNLGSPVKDLNASLKRGDKRFIGINGYTCDAPGVTDADQRFATQFGLNCLDGASDVVGSDEHLALIEKATSYALAYNTELLRRIHAGLIRSR